MPLPTFIVVGELKAGTTSLYHYLKEHPQVFMPGLKEPRFFAFDPNNAEHRKKVPSVFPITSFDDYIKLFEDARGALAIGEASPNYIHNSSSAARIRHYLPLVKIIAIIRNPVDRLISEYTMNVRAGRERRPFRIFFEESVRENSWIIASSFPSKNWQRFLEVFPGEQLKAILFDDFSSDTLNVVQSVYRFIGVDCGFTPEYQSAYNVGGIPSGRMRQVAFRIIKRHRMTLRKMFPEAFAARARRYLRGNMQKIVIDEQDRCMLCDFYHDDIKNLENMLKRDLRHWLCYY